MKIIDARNEEKKNITIEIRILKIKMNLNEYLIIARASRSFFLAKYSEINFCIADDNPMEDETATSDINCIVVIAMP